uniref:Uncharacterized protein n=1 Tax=Cannabis sativa TaxID=3483 RepID=A0A803PYJ0_CANSA
MAKKKRVIQKPVSRVEDLIDEADETGEKGETDGLNLIAEVVKVGELGRGNGNQEKEFEYDLHTGTRSNRSWAQIVEQEEKLELEQGIYQASAKNHWNSLAMEPMIKDGVKIAQVDVDEVKEQAANWSSTLICMVLGTNPPHTVFKGFIKRVWGHLEIAQIARMANGLTMSWEKPIAVRGFTGIYLKLMRLKHQLKKFNYETVGNIGRTYHEAKTRYLEARLQAQTHPTNLNLQQNEFTAAGVFSKHEKSYHSFLKQRSKVIWIRKGDTNTSYFHACLKKRKIENRIVSFTIDHGVVNDNFKEVVEHFLCHFRSYMGSSNKVSKGLNMKCLKYGVVLTLDQQLEMLKLFTDKEIKKALFSIPDSKSPGPDGYG